MSVCMRARIATGPNQGPSISEYSWAGGPPPLHLLLRRREHPRRIATDEEEAIAGGAPDLKREPAKSERNQPRMVAARVREEDEDEEEEEEAEAN
uniref:Uncharacterized protein n=4 Tax=Oryza TaxID=4527 RepID=A0A1V1H8L4_ORYSJ|nr:hypothetical protein [Oryza sativa Japonica Group]BAD69425.1 hypothetical protein [Oryza sativa Japonica Group]BAX24584.1 hypothetical protein [Oryza sativa Japonica Group]BAX24601.1 hypothetical protein [Oryza sativa Indica Group]BAX24697.1 hypothetical protein [Oryza rufipogon]